MPTRSPRLRHLLLSALLLPAVASLGGCEIWNGMLDMLKWKDASAKKDTAPLAGSALSNLQPGAPGSPTAVIPRVTVYRISTPLGNFSGNDQIWSQLNEDALDSKTSVLMAQNGLRAATGALSRWPVIAGLLDANGSSTDQFLYQTDGRSSVNVVTRPGVTDQIVVSIDRDLQQQGRTFERCDNGFRLSMRPVKNKPELLVQLEPTVTLGTVEVTRATGELGVGRSSFTSEESFADLRLGAALRPDQFLVIAAADPKTSPFSVGTLWLSNKDKVPPMETVLIFVPASATPPAAPAKTAKK